MASRPSDFEAEFSRWLRSKQLPLQQAMAEAMCAGLSGLNAAQLAKANASLNNLYASDAGRAFFPGSDCDYRLPGIGPLYTAHFHGKRVHDALSVLVPRRAVLFKRPQNVIDIGAGTGAVLWAWTLLACFAYDYRVAFPVHTWTSVDSSLDMLAQNDRLWDALCRALPHASRFVRRQRPLHCGWNDF